MKREITDATAQTHKKKKTEGEKKDCFPTLVINIDQHLNDTHVNFCSFRV